MKLEGLDHVAITVRDPLSSMVWYQDVLGLERRFEEAWGDYPIVMLAGESGVALFPASSADPETVPDKRNTITMRHFAFRVDSENFKRVQERMRWWVWNLRGKTTASRTRSTSATPMGTRSRSLRTNSEDTGVETAHR